MNITRKVQLYIRDCSIDVEEVQRQTGVSKALLTGESNRPFNATEFLEVCTYLKIKPEEIKGYEGK